MGYKNFDLKTIEIDGNKLRALRENKKLSLEDVGREIGVERGTVHNYEKGHANPSANVLARICILFDVPIENLTNVQSEDLPSLKKFSSCVS